MLPSPRPCRTLPSRGAVLLISLLAAALAVAQQGPSQRAVNPLTGMPLSLEDMHWSLEQAHLEEQLQASLLNRRRFELERQRLEQGDSASAGRDTLAPAAAAGLDVTGPGNGRVPRRPVNGDPDRLVRGSPAAAAVPVRPHAQRRPGTPAPPLQTWQVVGVRARGAEWCLLVSEDLELWPVCAGESRHGHHVDAVSAQGYTVDGRVVLLEQPAGQLHTAAPLAGLGDAELPASTAAGVWPNVAVLPAASNPGAVPAAAGDTAALPLPLALPAESESGAVALPFAAPQTASAGLRLPAAAARQR